MKSRVASGVAGLALSFSARSSLAQGGIPVQLAWRAPASCPQEAQVRQKLRDLLGANAGDAASSRLRAEGQIEPVGERFRLTLNIHYDQVNGTRVVEGNSCEDLGGVAAITLALLFRAEHSSSAPLTAGDLGGTSTAAGGADSRAGGADERSSKPPPASEKDTSADQDGPPKSDAANRSSFRFAFRVPELRVDVGALPEPSYGIGLALGLRHEAWRFLASGTLWLGQDYDEGPFLGYGAHFRRISGELSACRGWQFSGFELAPCLLLTLDDVLARGTGVGISSTNPWTAWVSVGAGFQGLWQLNRNLALVLGLHGRVATSRPRFVTEGIGEDGVQEISQVGPAALGVVLGCEWVL